MAWMAGMKQPYLLLLCFLTTYLPYTTSLINRVGMLHYRPLRLTAWNNTLPLPFLLPTTHHWISPTAYSLHVLSYFSFYIRNIDELRKKALAPPQLCSVLPESNYLHTAFSAFREDLMPTLWMCYQTNQQLCLGWIVRTAFLNWGTTNRPLILDKEIGRKKTDREKRKGEVRS